MDHCFINMKGSRIFFSPHLLSISQGKSMKSKNFTEGKGNHCTERKNKATASQIFKSIEYITYIYSKNNEPVHANAELPSVSIQLKTTSVLFSFTLNEQEAFSGAYMLPLHAIRCVEFQTKTSHDKLEAEITCVRSCPPVTQNILLENCYAVAEDNTRCSL